MDIYDIAKIAGVAPSTASKALNGTGQLKPETRQLVLSTARKLNYYPSHLGRALARRKTENIGVITIRYFSDAAISNPFYSGILEGIEQGTVGKYNMVFSVIPWQMQKSLEVPRLVRERSVDGVLLLGTMPEDFVKQILEHKMPSACIEVGTEKGEPDSFLIDNRDGAQQAVDHLRGLGHKKIAMLAGPAKNPSFSQRAEGFKKALAKAGLKPMHVLTAPEGREQEDGWMAPLVEGSSRPTAVFCCNDNHALRLMAVARAAGLRVPEDLSIVGFDDVIQASYCNPPLSTLAVDKVAMGTRATQRLIERIQDPKMPYVTERIGVSLVVRGSTSKKA